MKIVALIICIFLWIFLSYFGIFRYLYLNIYPTLEIDYKNLPRVNKSKPVIISLTTIPDKIQTIKYTLASILTQTQRVDEIRLYLPSKTRKGKTYDIPIWLTNLEKKLPEFKIKRCEKDFGPGTKIIPAILEEKNRDIYIIYIDDDIIYHKDTVETLVSYSNIYPNYAIANSGAGLDNIQNYSFLNYTKYQKNNVKIVEGFSGVIVRPRFFDHKKLLSVYNFPDSLIYNDDVCLSGLLAENKITRICTTRQRSIPYFYELFKGYILRSNPVSLSSSINKTDCHFKTALSQFKWT